jgi:hypothetical protein
MSQPHHDADAKLDESLRRIRGALDYNRNHYAAMVEQIVAATGVEVAERVTGPGTGSRDAGSDGRDDGRGVTTAMRRPFQEASSPRWLP